MRTSQVLRNRLGLDVIEVVKVGGEITRREALRNVSAGAMLALGLWPGIARGQSGGKFRFVVVNDTHYLSDECGVWLRGVVRKIRSDRPEFCIIAGDLTEHGTEEHLRAVRGAFKELGVPFHVVIGNHDYATHTQRGPYEKIFPNRINYWFEREGWQFVGLDTTEGTRYENTNVQAPTLRWLDEQLPKLEKVKPTVIFTHFPLGVNVQYRPLNADVVLDKFREFNLRAVFSGHFHGYTQRRHGEALLTTNCACALKRGNHDNTTVKGYFVCEAKEQSVTRTLVQVG